MAQQRIAYSKQASMQPLTDTPFSLPPPLLLVAQLIFGASIDQSLGEDEIVVTLIATGFAPPPSPPPLPPPIFDVFAYRPPQANLEAKDGKTTLDDALDRWGDYLDARIHGSMEGQQAIEEAAFVESEREAAAREAAKRVQVLKAERSAREAKEAEEEARAAKESAVQSARNAKALAAEASMAQSMAVEEVGRAAHAAAHNNGMQPQPMQTPQPPQQPPHEEEPWGI